MILLSLQSPHVSEVKASLFAAGCFCLLSDDFACIVLEILIDIVSSLQVPSEVIFTAVRVFSKMRCSSSIATRAYKAGKKLVMGSLPEEFKAEMLSSLSILASRSIILYNEQADLLLSCLTGEHTSIVKARALKCLYSLLRGGYNFPVNSSVLNKLFHIVDDNDLPLIYHCRALRILCKIFCTMRADLTYIGVPDLLKFARIVEREAQSSAEGKKYLCLRLLASILCSLKTVRGGQCNRLSDKSSTTCLQSHGCSPVSLASSGEDPEPLVMNFASYIIDHMQHLMKQKFSACDSNMVDAQNSTINDMHSTMKKRWKHLLDLVLPLAEQYPSSGLVALDRIICLIETLVSMHENFKKHTDGHSQMEMVADKPISIHPNSVEGHANIFPKIISSICRFIDTYLDILDETEVCCEVYKKVKLLVEQIEQGGYCDGYAYEIFCLCMRSASACPYLGITDNSTQDVSQLKDDVKLGLVHDVCWVCREWRTLEFTKTMLRRRNNWAAYRAGKYACGRGLWFAATFAFRKLIDMTQSDSCRYWLRSLMLLSGGESEIKLLLFPEVGKELVGGLQTESKSRESFSHISGDEHHCVDIEVDLCDYEGKLARVYSRICSSEEILSAAGASDGVFFFQRWFLILRAKVLETLIDLLGLLSSHTIHLNGSIKGSADIYSTVEAPNLGSIIACFSCISLRWSRLAKEYDLLATSFPDIDSESFRSISSLSLSCSLLSFCTTFALYLPKSPTHENGMMRCFDNSTKFSPAVILRDLSERLSDVDEELTTQLQQFMPAPGEVIDNYQSRTHINSAGYMEKALVLVCRFAVAGVLCSQEAAKGASDEELYPVFTRGLQLISDVIRKLLGLPFQTPKFFFRVRSCIGADLFIHNGDSSNKCEISCLAGSQLSLTLCLQIKNVSMKVAKVYCILAARSSDRSSGGRGEMIQQMIPSFHGRNTDEMVELSELLLMYMRTDTKGTSSGDLVTTHFCFELNENGQGFASCALDVSAFPVGSYPIKWHSCCFVENGSLWSLMPLNSGCIFTIKKSED